MKITDADRAILNPKYIEKLEAQENMKEIQDRKEELPDWLRTYVDEMMSDPMREIDCPFIKKVIECLNDPTKCSQYKEMMFKGSNAMFQDIDEPPSKGFTITIPIISGTF